MAYAYLQQMKLQSITVNCVIIMARLKQEALLLQRDCATRLSVQILQLQNIPF